MVSNQGVFKSSAFGGFKKQDVLRYVDELNKQKQDEMKDIEQRMNVVNGERDMFANQLFEKEQELQQLQEELKEKDKALEELREDVEELKSDLVRYKSALRKKELDYQLQAERTKHLEYKADGFSFKSRKYDELNEKIGETVTEAKRQAELILDNAQKKTKVIVQDAKTSMDAVSRTLGTFKDEILTLRKSLERFSTDLSRKIDDMDAYISKTSSTLISDEDNLSEQIVHEVSEMVYEQQQELKRNLEGQYKTSIAIHNLEQAVDNAAEEGPKFDDEFAINDSVDFFPFAVDG